MRARLLLQRSTELVRSSGRPGESCPGCQAGLVPDGNAGSLPSSSGEESVRAPVPDGGEKRWSGSLRLDLRGIVPAGGTGGAAGIPAGLVDDHAVDPAQQGGGARDAGLGAPGACRGLRSRARRRRPRHAPGAPRPASRAPPPCCAGSTAWSSTRPAGIPAAPPVPPAGTMPRKSRRRLPDQRFSPPSGTGALDFPPPMRGRASPHFRRGPAPPDTLGSSPLVARSFSPARLNAVGAGVPAFCGHAEPACTTWCEKTRVTGAQDRAARRPSCRRGTPPCPH